MSIPAKSVRSLSSPAMVARLGLGAAQFGSRYGATNQHAALGHDDIRRILARAEAAGIRWIDTAPYYGDSETLLGATIASPEAFRITTKVAPLADVPIGEVGRAVRDGALASLSRLKRSSIDALLLHRASDLARQDWNDLVETLQSLKREGIARRIGVSLYDQQELELVLGRFTPDIVQVPLNPLDRRFVGTDLGGALRRAGIAVHVRSVFLQGLLVASPNDLPAFARDNQAIAKWRQWIAARNLSPLAACLAHAMTAPNVEVALIGVARPDELEEILQELHTLTDSELPFEDLPRPDIELIDPRRWPQRLGREGPE